MKGRKPDPHGGGIGSEGASEDYTTGNLLDFLKEREIFTYNDVRNGLLTRIYSIYYEF